MEGQASLHWSRHKFRKWQEECKWKVKDRRGKQRKCSLFVFFNVVAENIGNIPTKSSLSQGTVFSYAGASVRNMLCGFVFAFQRIYINRLFKKKKKRHDIVSPNSWAKDYDFKIYRRWFRNCDSIFFHLMMLLFLYMMLLLIFFSWAWTTELELTKMWLNSLSSKLQLWVNRINSNTIALCRLSQLKKSNLISCCFLLCSTFKYWLWGDVHMGIYVCCKFLPYIFLHNILM